MARLRNEPSEVRIAGLATTELYSGGHHQTAILGRAHPRDLRELLAPLDAEATAARGLRGARLTRPLWHPSRRVEWPESVRADKLEVLGRCAAGEVDSLTMPADLR